MILSNPLCFKILKTLFPGLLIWWLISSCSTGQLPELHPYARESVTELENRCLGVFLKKNTQLVHALGIQLPGKHRSSVIGITNVFPREKTLESVIMSVEGLVLFHARFSEESKEVFKSIDPFTSEQFSEGLLRDIQLIFLKPDGNLMHSGATLNGTEICRYTGKNQIIDILLPESGNWAIKKYKNKSLIKSIQASDIGTHAGHGLIGYPGKLVMKHSGVFGYSLEMKLIRMEHIK